MEEIIAYKPFNKFNNVFKCQLCKARNPKITLHG